jgi:hypothetical protein
MARHINVQLPQGDKMSASVAAHVLAEHSRVTSVRDFSTDGQFVRKGACGTIVHVIGDGVGHIVEFTEPDHIIISARADEVTLA